jgi:Family of unknown function (DUF6263)
MLTLKTRAAGLALLAISLFTLLNGAAAEAQTSLVYKFKKGDTINYSTATDMKQSMSVGGMVIKTTMTQGMEVGWTVNAVQDGKAEMTQKINQFRQKMELPGGQGFEFDSKAGKKPEGPIGQIAGPVLEAMVGAETAFKMDPQGEMSDTKISEKLLKAIKGTPALAQMGGMFSEEGMKNMMQQSAVAFPKEPISKGKTWSKTVDVKMPFGVMKLATTYTYQGPETRNNAMLEKIDTKSDLSIEPAAGANISLKIKSSDVKGAIYFDNKTGRIAELSQTQKMVMEVSTMGQTFDTNQEQTTTMKLVP